MRCPFCGHTDTQVKDSRPSDDQQVIRRRRECLGCGRRFTTFERFQVQQVMVAKRSGRRELFDPDKLTKSLLTALRKRPVTHAAVAKVVGDIEQKFVETGRSEVTSQELGDTAMEGLMGLDFIGFVRYASVYKDFDKAEDFKKLIDSAH